MVGSYRVIKGSYKTSEMIRTRLLKDITLFTLPTRTGRQQILDASKLTWVDEEERQFVDYSSLLKSPAWMQEMREATCENTSFICVTWFALSNVQSAIMVKGSRKSTQKNSIRSQLKITEWSHFLPDFLISFQLLLQRPYRSSNLRMNFQWYRNYAVIFCTVQKELH